MSRPIVKQDQAEQAERLRSIPHTAERLGVSPWTVRYWIQRGQIASHRLHGRRLVAESEIQRLIDQSRVPARAEA